MIFNTKYWSRAWTVEVHRSSKNIGLRLCKNVIKTGTYLANKNLQLSYALSNSNFFLRQYDIYSYIQIRAFQLQIFVILQPCHIEQMILIPHGQNIRNFSKILLPPGAHLLPYLIRIMDFAKIRDILSIWYKE